MRRFGLGFGDGDAASGSYDPGDPAGNVAAGGDINDLLKGQADWQSHLTNVDPATALASRIEGTLGKGTALPLMLIALGGIALAMIPASAPRGRR